MPQPKPTTIRLSGDDMVALLQIAARVGSLSTTGTTAGQPSWRALVRDIARGKLRVVKK